MARNKQNTEQSQQGFSLIEVLAALAILAMSVGPLLGMLVQASRTNAVGVRTQKTLYAARNELERLYSSADYAQLFSQAGVVPGDEIRLEVSVVPSGSENGRWVQWIIDGDRAMLALPDGALIIGDAGQGLAITRGATGYTWRWGNRTGQISTGELSVWCALDRSASLEVPMGIVVEACMSNGAALNCTPDNSLRLTNSPEGRADGLLKVTVTATPVHQVKGAPVSPQTLEAVIRVPFGGAL